jgi:hypothetical protein
MIGSVGLYLAYADDILITVAHEMAQSREEISMKKRRILVRLCLLVGVGLTWSPQRREFQCDRCSRALV